MDAPVMHGPRPATDAEVLAALENIQSGKMTRRRRVWTLSLSLLAFVAAGVIIAQFRGPLRLSSVLIALAALLVHELGHYLAMRRLGYRDPITLLDRLFGTTLHRYAGVPIARQSIVYLLGPVPGIFIGYLCGLMYLLTAGSLWRETAEVFVALNVLSLLPLYPLDGSRFVLGLMPQRTYRVQWLFLLIVAVLVGAVGFQTVPVLMGGFGVAVASLWPLHQLNTAAARLLASGAVRGAARADVIPPQIAREILEVVRHETYFTKPDQLADAVSAVWAQLKAERPTRRQVAGLLALYLSVLLPALAVSAVYLGYGSS